METLTIGLKEARAIFPGAPESFKSVLKDHFGDKVADSVIDRVKTFEDACNELGIDPQIAIPFKVPSSSFHRGVNAVAKLFIITEALNECAWQPDWTNADEYKYAVWYEGNKNTGSGLSSYDFGRWISDSVVGSRLCFKTRELAEYAGRQFEAEYIEFFTNK